MELTRSRQQASGAVASSNIRSLQRKDPHIARILDTATHVVAYAYNKNTQAWEKKNVEGSLFVFERTASPAYGFAIVNRQNPRDLLELLGPDMSLKDSDPYLYYRNSQGEIVGLWFYDAEERGRITSFLLSLSTAAPPPSAAPSTPGSAGDGQAGLLAMLQRAASQAQPPPAYPAYAVPQPYPQAPGPHPGAMHPPSPARAAGPVQADGGADPGLALLQQLQRASVQPAEEAGEAYDDGRLLADALGRATVGLGHTPVPRQQASTGDGSSAAKAFKAHGFVPTQARTPKKKAPPAPLTREQFRAALIARLQGDDVLVAGLHDQYLAALHQRPPY